VNPPWDGPAADLLLPRRKQVPTLTVADAVRRAQLLAGCFLLYLLVLPAIVEKFFPKTSGGLDQTYFLGICFVSIAEIGIALVIRSRYPLTAEEVALETDEAARARKWMTIQIASYAIATSVALYGVALRAIGASLTEAIPFYVVALVLLVSWWPRKP
jgi:hypothetical protein